jgi:hypothetical protein
MQALSTGTATAPVSARGPTHTQAQAQAQAGAQRSAPNASVVPKTPPPTSSSVLATNTGMCGVGVACVFGTQLIRLVD